MAEHVLLGPTNTGKTHRAIERMLDFESGMIGLPLRLLAREVYDRVSLRVGEQAVALVTGEEKRVPTHPRYWVCTIEAMPIDLELDFAAVDEIQLMSHPERGHVFTDRLLHLRLLGGEDASEPDFAEQLVSAKFVDLTLTSDGHLHFAGKRVARLVMGSSLLHPHVKLLLSDLGAGMRARVERRLLAHAKDLVLGLLSPLKFADEPSAPLRGLLYQLEQGLGTASRRDTAKLVRTLPPEERAQLLRAQIYVGQDSVFARPMLSGAHLILRRALARLSDPALDAIKSALEEVAAVSGVPSLARESALRLGYVPLGKWLLRCDVLELLRVARKECSEDRELALRVQLLLGSEPEATAQIVRALGTTASKRARHA